ncbi:MAG: ATP-binding protein [Thermoleophilaceae bacterium]|nr:ATP-binding protein [Thermoleophilaceae bacterium]
MTIELSAGLRPSTASAVRLRLDALPENVMLVRQALDGAARGIGASSDVIDDLKLAVTEACSNVVKYAYRGASGELVVSFEPLEDGFIVFVQDSGSWLNRGSDEDAAGGLGIPLMEAVTRDLEIGSNGQGTTVRLEFALIRSDIGESAESDDA